MADSKRLLITGSRGWDNRAVLARALKKTYREMHTGYAGKIILVSGNAQGADIMAEEIWAKKVDPNWIERHPAKNYGHPLERNRAMVELGADVCLAFLQPCYKGGCQAKNGFHYSHGGAMTKGIAEKAGIDTRLITDPNSPPF